MLSGAVEPSASMRSQRPAHLATAIDAIAEDLPFADDSFDAVMAMITVHQWSDTDRGLRELRRVSRGPVVVLTFDGTGTVSTIPVPVDCVDGFAEAYYARPERLLDPAVRQSQSAWGFVEPAAVDRAVAQLRADLDSGEWHRRYGAVAVKPEFVGSLRLITAMP
jgi:ubiquinone/menaquinone biosynthesis C-methylase UbiE